MSAPGIFRPPAPHNEPVKGYEPGSPDRAQLQARLREMEGERIEIPLVIGGKDVSTGQTFEAVMPHDRDHVLADVHKGSAQHVEQAIAAARPVEVGGEPLGERMRAVRRTVTWARVVVLDEPPGGVEPQLPHAPAWRVVADARHGHVPNLQSVP